MTNRNHVIFRPTGDIVPVKAVQYDGTPAAGNVVHRLLGGYIVTMNANYVVVAPDNTSGWRTVNTDQWLAVSESGDSHEVWVLDGEPVWVERTNQRRRDLTDDERCEFVLNGSRCPMERGHYSAVHNYSQIARPVSHTQAVYSNGMTGPWVEVDK